MMELSSRFVRGLGEYKRFFDNKVNGQFKHKWDFYTLDLQNELKLENQFLV